MRPEALYRLDGKRSLAAGNTQRVAASDEAKPTRRNRLQERRRVADRRQHQLTLSFPDRRKSQTRRRSFNSLRPASPHRSAMDKGQILDTHI